LAKPEIILPLSYPAPAAAGKTGTWRVKRPVVDHKKCVKCRMCWLHCPDGVIGINEEGPEFVTIDYEYCKGCGICERVCPVKAIKMVPEV